MKKQIILLSAFVGLSFSIFSYTTEGQNNSQQTLFTFNHEKVTKGEFEQVYSKNNSSKNISYSEQSLREYLDLYINFKLKVIAAKELGLDTMPGIKGELINYRKQLSKTYLMDKEVTENLMNEAYERMKKEIHAKHILVLISPDASSEDTLKAYKKIMDIKKRLDKKEDFSTVAKELSEDPSAKDNGGDLGYFSALQMVYPFETASYNTPVGSISNPVRTKFGYHLIKVEDNRPSRGQILVQHILIKTPKNSSDNDRVNAKNKIDEVFEKVKKGESFDELAKTYSDDHTSSNNGGKLPWFGSNRMVADFENIAFSLKNNGDVSGPFKTEYGWHIVKRIDKKEIAPLVEMKDDLKTKIEKDSRSELSKQHFINRLKKEYNFKEISDAKKEMWSKLDSSLIRKNFRAEQFIQKNTPLFSFADKTVSQKDFAEYLEKNQRKVSGSSVTGIADKLMDDYINQTIMDYEKSHLENKFPDFKNLMNEYRDGILLFELTDKNVWSMAVQDTNGLKNFHAQQKDKYMWKNRVAVIIYKFKNAEAAQQFRSECEKKGSTPESALKKLNNDNSITIEEGTFEKGQNPIVDEVAWKVGLSQNIKNNDETVSIVGINKLYNPAPKSLEEAKGYVVADYQEYLEKKWLSDLRKKYNPQVDESVFKSLIK